MAIEDKSKIIFLIEWELFQFKRMPLGAKKCTNNLLVYNRINIFLFLKHSFEYLSMMG